MGLSPAWGGLTRLVERVGPIEAARLLYTAEKIDAAEALRIGLVNEVVPKGSARAPRHRAGVAHRRQPAHHGGGAQARAARGARGAPRARRWSGERAVFFERWGAADHRDAMSAFLAKR